MRRDYTLVTFRSVSRTTADDERVRLPKEKVGTGKSKGFALAAHQAWGKSRCVDVTPVRRPGTGDLGRLEELNY